MSKLFQGILSIADMSGFGHLGRHIPGVQFYADRSLMTPVDVAVIQSDGFDDYLVWLRSVGIGPKRIMCVDDENLFRGLLNGPAKISEFSMGPGGLRLHWNVEPEPIKMLQAFTRRGGKIQVFCMTEESEDFFRQADIDRTHIQSAPLESARLMNDKAELRRMAETAGVPQAFLPHCASRDPQRIMSETLQMLARPESEAEFVVLKRTNLASGDGFLKIPRGLSTSDVKARVIRYLRAHHWNELKLRTHSATGLSPDDEVRLDRAAIRDVTRCAGRVRQAFDDDAAVTDVTISRSDVAGGASLRMHRGGKYLNDLHAYLEHHGRNEIIVEAGFEHWPYSNLVVIRGGHLRILGPTRQIVDAETGTHQGNMMLCHPVPEAFPERLSGHPNDVLTKEDMIRMHLYAQRLAEDAHTRQEGYEDYIGFDFMKRARDGEIFLLECNARLTASAYPLAIAAQLTGPNWGIVMLNGLPTAARNFAELRALLPGRLFRTGQGGLIPFNIRLMTLDAPHCGMIAVAPTLNEAISQMDEARALLSA